MAWDRCHQDSVWRELEVSASKTRFALCPLSNPLDFVVSPERRTVLVTGDSGWCPRSAAAAARVARLEDAGIYDAGNTWPAEGMCGISSLRLS